VRNALSDLFTWLSALFLAMALRLNGRSQQEIEQIPGYIHRLLEPPTGEIEEPEP
jgi:hypothetical protein